MLGNLTIRKVLLLCLLIMLLPLLYKSAGQIPDLMAARLLNPDSYTKPVLLHGYTPGTGFPTMMRDNAPYGSYLHWSMEPS